MIAFIGVRSGHGYQIYTMADDGAEIRCLTETFPPKGAVFFGPILSPDGKFLAFTFQEHRLSPYTQVCTLSIDSGHISYLSPRETREFALKWLLNGSIVYTETTMRPLEADEYLCTMRGDGSERQRVFHYGTYRGFKYSPDSYHGVALSPDGTKIAMVSWRDHQLYIAREGLPPARVKNEGGKIQNVGWAFDSARLAFTSVRSQTRTAELWVIQEDGMNRKHVGRILAESGFAWSPDNKYIATTGLGKGTFTINVIDPQISESRMISTVETDPNSQDIPTCPIWSPDAQCLLYTTFAYPYVHIYRADIAASRTQLIVGDEGAFRLISQPSWH